jgi:hypothetical protein
VAIAQDVFEEVLRAHATGVRDSTELVDPAIAGCPDADPPASSYTPSAVPGCLAPHVWLSPGRSTIDLFDREPILVTGPAAAPPARSPHRPGLCAGRSSRTRSRTA